MTNGCLRRFDLLCFIYQTNRVKKIIITGAEHLLLDTRCDSVSSDVNQHCIVKQQIK